MAILPVLACLLAACQWQSAGWDATGSADNTFDTQITTTDVGRLGVEWTADTVAWGQPPQPVAVGNTVVEVGDNASEVMAFSADGAGCSGTPRTCPPLWVAHGTQFGQPLVYDGRVYVDDVGPGQLLVFDLAGSTGCTGSAPAVCTPLWRGTTEGSTPIAADDGLIYVGDDQHSAVVAYDPDGGTCSGSPSVCQPVATYPTASNSAVTAIAADDTHVYALLTGSGQSPPGTSVYSQGLFGWPLGNPASGWAANLDTGGATNPGGALMAVDGHVYVAGAGADRTEAPPYRDVEGTDELAAFDPDGTSLWTSMGLVPPLAASPTAIFAAEPGSPSHVVACDPTNGCGPTGTSALRSYRLPNVAPATTMLIDDGVLVVGWGGSVLRAFDAGSSACSGTPLTCPRLADISLPNDVNALSATNGRLYAMVLTYPGWSLYSLRPGG